jgi:inner membrane protein
MYKKGHYGAALLAYAPLGTVTLLVGFPNAATAGGIATALLATVPDLDMKIPSVAHRGPTHTVQFAVMIGALLAVLSLTVAVTSDVSPIVMIGSTVFGFLTGSVAIGSHIAADALTPMGVEPFGADGPHYSLGWVRAANQLANYALLGVGLGAVAAGAWLAEALGAGM